VRAVSNRVRRGGELGPDTVKGQTPDDTVDMREVQAAYLDSGSAGTGVLFFRGTEYPFEVGGFGLSPVEATGEVYNLQELGQFPGTYGQARYGFAISPLSGGDLWMQNEAGVIMHLKAKRGGGCSASGATPSSSRCAGERPVATPTGSAADRRPRTSMTKTMISDTPAADPIRNEQTLLGMGASKPQTRALIKHPWYPVSVMTSLVTALDRLPSVDRRGPAGQLAAATEGGAQSDHAAVCPEAAGAQRPLEALDGGARGMVEVEIHRGDRATSLMTNAL
jgi:hypothetical protein